MSIPPIPPALYVPPPTYVPAPQRAPTQYDDTTQGHLTTDLWNYGGAIYSPQQVTANNANWAKLAVPTTPLDVVAPLALTASLTSGGALTVTSANAAGTILVGMWVYGSGMSPVRITGQTSGTTGAGSGAVYTTTGTAAVASQAMGASVFGVAYGMILLRKSYAGYCCRITRASDSTYLDIGFVPSVVNGRTVYVVDEQAADAFVFGTTGYVTTMYDQGYLGLNAPQSTLANAPQWIVGDVVGTMRCLNINGYPAALLNLPSVPKWLAIPAGFSWQPSTTTFFFAGQNTCSAESRTLIESTDNTTFTLSANFASAVNGPEITMTGTGCNVSMESSPAVMAVGHANGCYCGNNYASFPASSVVANLAGANLGRSIASNPAIYRMLAVISVSTTLTAVQHLNLRASLHLATGITPQSDGRFIIVGHSTSNGNGSIQSNSWPLLALPFLPPGTKLLNFAVAGNQLKTMAAATGSTSVGIQLPRAYNAYDKFCVVMIFAISNDCRQSFTTASSYANLRSIINTVRTGAPIAKIIVCTEDVQGDILGNSGELALLQAFNAMVVANWNVPQSQGGLGADALCDFQSNPTIGQGNYTTSFATQNGGAPNIWCWDGQHPTDLIMPAWASFAAPIIRGAITQAVGQRVAA